MKSPSNKKIKVQSAFVEMSSMFLMLRGVSGKACMFCSSPGLGDGSIYSFICLGCLEFEIGQKWLSFQA